MAELTPPEALTRGPVTIRPWHAGDADALVARISDPLVGAYLDQVPQPYSLDDARHWFEITADGWQTGSMATFAIELDGVDGPVGGVGVRFFGDLDDGAAEIGYWVGEEARGRGVATAATRLAAEWAFEADPGLARLQLRADVENAASNRVAEKAGFTREGVLRAQRLNARLGRRTDFVMWSLLRAEL